MTALAAYLHHHPPPPRATPRSLTIYVNWGTSDRRRRHRCRRAPATL